MNALAKFTATLVRHLPRNLRMTINELDSLMDRSIGSYASTAGVTVSQQTALAIAAVYLAVRIISEDVASLPLRVYKRLPGGGKARADDHPLATLLHLRPNTEQTSLEFREMQQAYLCLRGNAYAEKQFDQSGRLIALWPIPPDYIDKITRPNATGSLTYWIKPQTGIGPSIPLSASQMFHLRGMTGNGVTGMNPIAVQREALAMNLAMQEFGNRYFENSTVVGGVFEHPAKLSKEAYTRLDTSLNQEHAGLTNVHRRLILEEGMKWHQTTVNPDDAQFMESRKWGVVEVARIFNVQPHRLMELSQSTNNNIEQQAIEHVTYTLRPWLVRWEQRMLLDLFDPSEWTTHFAEFSLDGLLRGDVKTRFEAYRMARQDGWMSGDEIRAMENMNPIPDGSGTKFWMPVNMTTTDNPIDPKAAAKPAPAMTPDAEMEAEKKDARMEAIVQDLREQVAQRQPHRVVLDGHLMEAVRRQPAPVQPISVVVNMPDKAASKRSYTINHADGSTSRVESREEEVIGGRNGERSL